MHAGAKKLVINEALFCDIDSLLRAEEMQTVDAKNPSANFAPQKIHRILQRIQTTPLVTAADDGQKWVV